MKSGHWSNPTSNKSEVEKLKREADLARDYLKNVEGQRLEAEKAKADAIELAEQAKSRAAESESRRKAADEANERMMRLQRAQDEKATYEGVAHEIWRFHTGPVANVAINPKDSKLIVTASGDGTAKVLDIGEKEVDKKVKHTLRSEGAAGSLPWRR